MTGAPQPGPSLDAYRSARIVMRVHGDRAFTHASGRVQELLLKNEVEGAAAWADICRAIRDLERGPVLGEARH